MKRFNPCANGADLEPDQPDAPPIPAKDRKAKAAARKDRDRKDHSVTLAGSSVTLAVNTERDLVELRFPGKPEESVRAEMKARRFRWYGPAGCWYHKHTPENLAWAQQFVARHTPATGDPAPDAASADAVPVGRVTSPGVPAAPADPEAALRQLLTSKGVPPAKQDEIIADATAKAQPGAMVGPFQIPTHLAAVPAAACPATVKESLTAPPAPATGKPVCVFCGRWGTGVRFNIFTPRFKPFGTACTDCEEALPPDTELPTLPPPPLRDSATPREAVAVPVVPPMPGMTPLGMTPKAPIAAWDYDADRLPLAIATRQLNALKDFLGPAQRRVLLTNFKGEEKQWFFDKVQELTAIIAGMPKTYEQDGLGMQAVAHLHYFAGGRANWYITEKDMGTPADPGQHQAFGLADLFGDGGELGYISIPEILANGGELDFHFRPRTLAEIQGAAAQRAAAQRAADHRTAGEAQRIAAQRDHTEDPLAMVPAAPAPASPIPAWRRRLAH